MRHFIKFLIALSLLLGTNVASAAQLANHLTLNNCADNQLCVARVQYDFTKDGGAVGTLDVATAGQNLMIVGAWIKSITTGTSGTSGAFVAAGPQADPDRFVNSIITVLTAGNAVVPPVVEGAPNVIAAPFFLAAGQKITQTIAVEALTAGKFEHVILYFKP